MFTTTFLHTHHSLLAKLSRWGWLMRMKLDWKKSQNTLDTSNRIHRNKTRSTGSVGKGLGSQLSHDWELHTRKQAGLFLPRTPEIGLRIINRPQSKPHQFAFYDMWGEGCLLLPRSSMGTFLLDLRPEAGYTFDPFWSTNLLQKVYVCVCERFLCSLFYPIGTHMGEQRCSGGFCNTVSRTQSVTKHVCRVQVQANI